LAKDKDVYRAVINLDPPFHLDWWYDSVAALQGQCIFEFSDWKLFAGNQTLPGTIETLIAAMPRISSLQDLISVQAPVTGRFGFDPLASQSALDAGYSPNSLKIPVPTSVSAELLSLFAIQVFTLHHNNVDNDYYVPSVVSSLASDVTDSPSRLHPAYDGDNGCWRSG
jgi:hypothetical protein